MNAYDDIQELLNADEVIEAVVFGDWGWSGFGEPEPASVPKDARGVVLTPSEAASYMEGWSFYGGYGAPNCYATYIWTNQRVIWVTQYDGSTNLDHAPRNPIAGMPNMPGG